MPILVQHASRQRGPSVRVVGLDFDRALERGSRDEVILGADALLIQKEPQDRFVRCERLRQLGLSSVQFFSEGRGFLQV